MKAALFIGFSFLVMNANFARADDTGITSDGTTHQSCISEGGTWVEHNQRDPDGRPVVRYECVLLNEELSFTAEVESPCHPACASDEYCSPSWAGRYSCFKNQ